jgi:NitT/TauT family transport system permease protein
MVLNWLKRSWLAQAAMARVAHPISEWLASSAMPAPSVQAPAPSAQRRVRRVTRLLGALVIGASGAMVVYGAWRLAHLLLGLSWGEWRQVFSGSMLTLARVSAAVVLGSLWTVPVGLWIGRSERLRSLLQPVAQIVASFPAPMLYPLVVLLLHQLGLGLGVGAVVLMLLGTQWYILFNVIAGASAVPQELREAAQAYHFTSRQRWRMVWWPAIFPYVITGWVTAAGGAWNASIVAEYVSMGDRVLVAPGLGSLISVAASQGHYALLAAGVLMMVLIVIGVNHVVWKPLARLAEVRYGL